MSFINTNTIKENIMNKENLNIKSLEFNYKLERFVATLSNNKIVYIELVKNTNVLNGGHGQYFSFIDYDHVGGKNNLSKNEIIQINSLIRKNETIRAREDALEKQDEYKKEQEEMLYEYDLAFED